MLQERISNSLVSDQMNMCLGGQVYSAVVSGGHMELGWRML